VLSDETDVFDRVFHLDGQLGLLMDGRPLLDSAVGAAASAVLLAATAVVLGSRHGRGQRRWWPGQLTGPAVS
jgi:hypothetical protein